MNGFSLAWRSVIRKPVKSVLLFVTVFTISLLLLSGMSSGKATIQMVRVTIPDLNIRRGPGTGYAKTGKYTGIGNFTIVEEADGKGASRWGLLKAYQDKRDGWISLDYAEKI